MPSERMPRSHLASGTLLDLLEDRLPAAKRRAAEAHLGLPCRACREKLRQLGAVLERMRQDALEPVPSELTRRALESFAAPAAAPAAAGLARRLALAFDSLAQAVPAATRRAVGEARRLRFEGEGLRLELECEV